MPYGIKSVGKGRYKVHNKQTGREMSKGSKSKAAAKKHLKALYANVPDARRAAQEVA